MSIQELSEKQRVKLLAIFKKLFVPWYSPSDYFRAVLELREKENTWNEKSVCRDVFQVSLSQSSMVPEEQLGERNAGIFCTLPPPRIFWDCWLAIYYLENPQVFPSLSMVAKHLLDYIKRVGLNPDGNYRQFEPFHLDYLLKMASADPRQGNLFLQDPIEALCLMKGTVMLASVAGGLRDPYLWLGEHQKEWQEQSKLVREATIDEFREFYSERKLFKYIHRKQNEWKHLQLPPSKKEETVLGQESDGEQERRCADPEMVVPGSQ